MRLAICGLGALMLIARTARADEALVVVRYDAPLECPSAETFSASVRMELAGRGGSNARPVQVEVTISRYAQGYLARATSSDKSGASLERVVQAPTCDEVSDVVATVIALAQTDTRPADKVLVAEVPPPPSPAATSPAPEPGVDALTQFRRSLSYSFTLGYGAFTAGPADPVIANGTEETTFNPAQGVRAGFGVTHAFGWWKQSLHVSAAYYRQSTTTIPVSTSPSGPVAPRPIGPVVDSSDRDVLHATIDACPIHVEYSFLSLVPCATFSMIQSRGNSGNDPELETGLGGSVRLRAQLFSKSFFVEGLGAATAVTSSYEPPSHDVRVFYALSLGATIQ